MRKRIITWSVEVVIYDKANSEPNIFDFYQIADADGCTVEPNMEKE